MSYSEMILAGLIGNRCASMGDHQVLIVENGDKSPEQSRTYQQLWDNGHRLAQVLTGLGLRPGQRFALLMANHAEFVDAMLAAAITGTVFVPIDPRAKGERLAFFLQHASCRGVLVADYSLPALLQVRSQLPELQWVLSLHSGEVPAVATPPEVLSLDLALLRAPSEPHPLAPLAADAAMQLIFTSGTTGNPKGIVMTHERYCQTALMSAQIFGYRADDRPWSGLSLTHANAQLVTLGAALAHGMTCVLSRRFSKSRLWDIARHYQCTSFTLLGGMTTAIYAEPEQPNDADNPVRFVISAGMPATIWEKFSKRFNVQILEFYGAAEGGLTINPIGVGPIGSIGKPPPTLQYRIVDEQGQDCPPGCPGELWFRHADNSPFQVEYLNNPSASRNKCADGWLRMGDVVVEDENGWLYFRYRMGSGIRSNGEFIDTTLIERVLAEHPDVDDVYVYGLPASSGAPGEKDVVAAVVPRHHSGALAQSLFKSCHAALPASHVPSRLQLLSSIPKTASEKPQERFLIEALEREPSQVHYQQRG